MSHDQLVLLAAFGGGVLALVTAALLLLSQGSGERELARRISKLREGAVVAPTHSRLLPTLIGLMRRMGNAMRGKMISAQDSEALAKSLAASGLEPAKATPIFISAKFACLFAIPGLAYVGAVLGGYSSGKQGLAVMLSLLPAMMLPNWVPRPGRPPILPLLKE